MPGLLVHVPEYGVAICSECQYAVQPTALSKHLLRHGVYRSERQAQLACFKHVKLLEPDDITPPLGAESIPELPLYEGRRCMTDGCTYTCVSEKRMQQHWREQHHNQALADRTAYLQTFFRGNKLRYFEVNRTKTTSSNLQPRSQIQANGTYVAGSFREVQDTKSEVVSSNPTLQRALHAQFDLDAMKLMHYCTVSTCLTLNRATESVEFLRMIVTRDAFEHEYLLFGFLCLTASHLATETSDDQKRDRYRQVSAQYQALALPAFRRAVTVPSRKNVNALILCSRLIGIHNMVNALLKWNDGRQDEFTPEEVISSVVESLTLLRGVVHIWLHMQQFLPPESEFLQPSEVPNNVQGYRNSASTSRINNDAQTSSAVFSPDSTISSPFTAQDFEQVSLLQDHLASMMISEDTATANLLISSFVILKQSLQCAISATNLRDMWHALEMWACLVPAGYIDLLASRHPGALLIFANWLCISKILEPHYWFLKGQSKRLLDSVALLLDENDLRFLPQFR